MTTSYDFDTPEGRLAAITELGIDGYNAAMAAHIADTCIETVNGYGIRPVSTRFGRLFAVDGTTYASSTLDGARRHAESLKAV